MDCIYEYPIITVPATTTTTARISGRNRNRDRNSCRTDAISTSISALPLPSSLQSHSTTTQLPSTHTIPVPLPASASTSTSTGTSSSTCIPSRHKIRQISYVFRTPRGKSTIATIPTDAPYDSFLRALLERAAETDRKDAERENDGHDDEVGNGDGYAHVDDASSHIVGGIRCHSLCLKTDDTDSHVHNHPVAKSMIPSAPSPASASASGNEQEHNVDLQLSRLSLNRHRSRNRNRKNPTSSPSTLPYGYGRLVRRRTDVVGYIENRSDVPSSSIRNCRHPCGGASTSTGVSVGVGTRTGAGAGSSAYISSDDDSTMGMDMNVGMDMEVDMDTDTESDVNFSHLAYVVLNGKILGRSEYLNLTAKHSCTDSGAGAGAGAGGTCATAAPITHHISLIVRLRGGMVDRQNRVGSKFGGGGVSSGQQSERERKERLRQLALETVDLAKDPYLMRNHLGTYECKLCLTLHTNEG